MKSFKKICSLLLVVFSLVSCSNKNNIEVLSISSTQLRIPTTLTGKWVNPFNTVMKLDYYKNSKTKYEENFDETLKAFYLDTVSSLHKQFDRHYSYYDDNNETITSIKTINDSYGSSEKIYCSDELYSLVYDGWELTKLTNGYFNFFIGNLNNYWEEIFSRFNNYEIVDEYDPLLNEVSKTKLNKLVASVPTLKEIESLITFNENEKSIVFNSLEDIEYNGEILSRSSSNSQYRPVITTGGIAKGHATDIIKNRLKVNNYLTGYLNSGSSSLSMLSDPTFTKTGKQTINIRDPRTSMYNSEIAFSLSFDKEFNLSTSGNYTSGKSYWIKLKEDSKKIYRHHIVNPFTGECSQYHTSVTIFSNTFTNGQLDALSTTLVNLSTEEGLNFRKSLLKLFPNHDLGIVYIASDLDNGLNITITEDTKDTVTFIKEGAIVNYE